MFGIIAMPSMIGVLTAFALLEALTEPGSVGNATGRGDTAVERRCRVGRGHLLV